MSALCSHKGHSQSLTNDLLILYSHYPVPLVIADQVAYCLPQEPLLLFYTLTSYAAYQRDVEIILYCSQLNLLLSSSAEITSDQTLANGIVHLS